ncbi:MAG: carbohydrate binding domain-containing protein [Xanthomonadales bacterium]|nr:carbohydrate binding domain-containing protein [Xanthomonadales bacterium]
MTLRYSPLLLILLASACHGDGQPPADVVEAPDTATLETGPDTSPNTGQPPAGNEAATPAAEAGADADGDEPAAVQIINGDFETGDSAPWSFSMHSDPTSFTLHMDSERPFEGNFSARIDSTGREPWGGIRQHLADPALATGGHWRLSLAARGQGTSEALSVFSRTRGQSTRTVPEERLDVPTGDYDWRELSWEFQVPEGARRLELAITHYGTGSLWLDAIALERLGDLVKPDGE